VIIRTAVGQDWLRIYPFFSIIVAAGRTYAFPEDLSLKDARPWWMGHRPRHRVYAVRPSECLAAVLSSAVQHVLAAGPSGEDVVHHATGLTHLVGGGTC